VLAGFAAELSKPVTRRSAEPMPHVWIWPIASGRSNARFWPLPEGSEDRIDGHPLRPVSPRLLPQLLPDIGDAQHVGRARRAERDARDDDHALAELGKAFGAASAVVMVLLRGKADVA
jgi:hypothetical protein